MKLAKGKIIKLALSIFLCLLAGFIGSIFTKSALLWYQSLHKPFFSPPDYVFGPVWTVLYIMMGIAFYIIWYHGFENENVKNAAAAFVIQLLLNIVWTMVFFGFKFILGGLLVIFLLIIAILQTIFRFRLVTKQASYLLLPYLIWVLYAAVLNFALYKLN